MSEEVKTAVVSALGLPRDVLLGDALISFVGRREVVIENYRSLLLYTDTLVKIQARTCRIILQGVNLQILSYTSEEMKIAGQISTLEFEGV